MRELRSASIILVLLAASCATKEQAVRNQHSAFPSSAKADSILDVADAIWKDSEYDSARIVYLKGREQAVADGDSSSVARADTWLGLAAWRLGQYKRARELGEAALAMKLRLGLDNDLFRSYNALGLLAHHEGRYADAVSLFENAQSSARKVNDSFSVAKATGNLGLVHSDLGQLDLARKEILYFASYARQGGDTAAFANQLNNLGMVEARAGDVAAAIDWLNKAKALYDAIDYATGKEAAYGQLGSVYSALGEEQRAIAYIDSAMAVARKVGLLREEAEDLLVYAGLISETGDHTSALRHLALARKLADSAGLQSRAGDIAREEAREHAALSRLDLAIARIDDAIAIHRKAGNEFELLEDEILAAEVAQSAKNPVKAQAALSDAGRIAKKLAVPVAQENVALGTARVADIAGDAAGVLRALPGGIRFVRLGALAESEANALRARAFARLGQWPEAVSSGRKAVDALDMVRGKIGEGPTRSAFMSDNVAVYGDLIVALLELGRTQEAFEVADAARGRALLDHLSALKTSARSSARDISDADRLLRRIDALTEQLRVGDTTRAPERTVALRNDQKRIIASLSAARTEYEDRMRRAARVDPRGSALLGASHVGLSEIRSALGADEILVEYFAMPSRLYGFVIARDTVVSFTSAIPLKSLGDRVRIVTDLMSHGNAAAGMSGQLRSLFDLVMGPVARLPQFSRSRAIVVVPDAALTYLPFAALIDRDGKYLVESHSILTMPSASAVPLLRRSQSGVARSADAIFAPFPQELRGTLDEAKSVKATLDNARVFLGPRATEAQLRAALESGGNVHVATHAVLNHSNPMFSRIELYPGQTRSLHDDGSLDLHEALEMSVRSDLVYLSGCETGAGSSWSTGFRRERDYATLSQAILYAGSQNVVATLWRVDDAGASVFATRFYHALKTEDPTAALAEAQRETLLDRKYSAPRYWAPYTLGGSGYLKYRAQTGSRVAVQ